jgi:hypothetical protein
MKVGKRFPEGGVLVVDFDVYNILNSSWPYTVNGTFSTAATSQWRRPTNVLQHRFFKIAGQSVSDGNKAEGSWQTAGGTRQTVPFAFCRLP